MSRGRPPRAGAGWTGDGVTQGWSGRQEVPGASRVRSGLHGGPPVWRGGGCVRSWGGERVWGDVCGHVWVCGGVRGDVCRGVWADTRVGGCLWAVRSCGGLTVGAGTRPPTSGHRGEGTAGRRALGAAPGRGWTQRVPTPACQRLSAGPLAAGPGGGEPRPAPPCRGPLPAAPPRPAFSQACAAPQPRAAGPGGLFMAAASAQPPNAAADTPPVAEGPGATGSFCKQEHEPRAQGGSVRPQTPTGHAEARAASGPSCPPAACASGRGLFLQVALTSESCCRLPPSGHLVVPDTSVRGRPRATGPT